MIRPEDLRVERLRNLNHYVDDIQGVIIESNRKNLLSCKYTIMPDSSCDYGTLCNSIVSILKSHDYIVSSTLKGNLLELEIRW